MTVDAMAMEAVLHARGLLARAVARARSADARVAAAGGELLAPRLGAWRDLAWNRVSYAEDDLAEAVATAMMGPGEFRGGDERHRVRPHGGIACGGELMLLVDSWVEPGGDVPPPADTAAQVGRMRLVCIPLSRVVGLPRLDRRRRRKGGAR